MKLQFPTMLRKMWSGGEVQKWLDENHNDKQDALVEHMVSQFLSMRIPPDFNPDGGVEYTPVGNGIIYGTNLLNYEQAKAMVLFMLDGRQESVTNELL
jgi:hypothetical protein